MVNQLEDYVIPRIVTLEAPLLAVVGGSTGAGKSTLVNSLVGAVVTESGVLRPTTRSPVLVHNPADADWFGADRLLPELERVDHPTHDPARAAAGAARRRAARGWRSSTPPTSTRSRRATATLAAQLLAAADLWLFVTSAARYADQVPWDFLRQAAERSAAVAIVLDRTPRGRRRDRRHPPGPDAGGPRAQGLAAVHRQRGALNDDGLLRAARRRRDPRAGSTELGGDADARAAMVQADPRGRGPHR